MMPGSEPTAEKSQAQSGSSATRADSAEAIGARARDHRGRWCRLSPKVGDGESPAQSERGPVDWSFTIPAIGCLGIALVGACAASSLAYLALSTITKQAPVWIPLSIGLVGALTYIVWALRRRRRNRITLAADALIQLWLIKGRCPSCGYTLAGIEPSPDDACVVCPECGSAWRPPRDASPESHDDASQPPLRASEA